MTWEAGRIKPHITSFVFKAYALPWTLPPYLLRLVPTKNWVDLVKFPGRDWKDCKINILFQERETLEGWRKEGHLLLLSTSRTTKLKTCAQRWLHTLWKDLLTKSTRVHEWHDKWLDEVWSLYARNCLLTDC